MSRLDGKIALVTGASRGIGAGIARRLASDGAKVVVNYASSRAKAEDVVREIEAAGGQALAAQADVTDIGQIERMFAELQGRIDALDILVNNAGRGSGGFPTLEQITPADYDSTFALNARAVFFVTQQAVKLMRDGGRVITISSMAPHVRYAGLGTYAASKAAADSFTRTWATELASRQITVNSVNSGIVETEMVAQMDPARKAELIAKIPLGRIGQTRDIADVVAFLASDESRWISGAEIPVSGGRYW